MSKANIFVYVMLRKHMYKNWIYKELPKEWKSVENEYIYENKDDLKIVEHFYGSTKNINETKMYLTSHFAKLKNQNVISGFDIHEDK